MSSGVTKDLPGNVPFLERVCFSVGGEAYSWGDVVRAARLQGDWAEVENEVRAGLACRKRLDDMNEPMPDAQEIDRIAAEFRYARELVTAAEMHSWLAWCELDVDDWMEFILRSSLRARWASEIPEIVCRYPVSHGEVEDVALDEAICGGHLGRLATMLAQQAAIDHWHLERGGEGDIHPTRDLARRDASLDRFREAALTEKVVRDCIAHHQLDWIRLHLNLATFSSASAAREAWLCVRHDGRRLSEVAAIAGTELVEATLYVEDAPAGWRDALVAALSGEILEPLPGRDGVTLVEVLEKVLPSDSDPALCRRAEDRVLAEAIELEVAARVVWRSRV